MPTIIAANESSLMVDGEAVEGVLSVEFRRVSKRSDVYALGSAERIGVVSGPMAVEARVTVASTSPKLDGLDPETPFQVIAQLKRGTTAIAVTFDECLMTDRAFRLSVGAAGESVYAFSAARVREEAAAS